MFAFICKPMNRNAFWRWIYFDLSAKPFVCVCCKLLVKFSVRRDVDDRSIRNQTERDNSWLILRRLPWLPVARLRKLSCVQVYMLQFYMFRHLALQAFEFFCQSRQTVDYLQLSWKWWRKNYTGLAYCTSTYWYGSWGKQFNFHTTTPQH